MHVQFKMFVSSFSGGACMAITEAHPRRG